MKVSEYIDKLKALQCEHGDLDVETYYYGRKDAYDPVVAFRKILHGRERRPDFWSKYEGEDCRGEKVIKV